MQSVVEGRNYFRDRYFYDTRNKICNIKYQFHKLQERNQEYICNKVEFIFLPNRSIFLAQLYVAKQNSSLAREVAGSTDFEVMDDSYNWNGNIN